ncbi:DNA recombination protein RmuC [Blattabacterium cuenoti]|uniref:DNA recombination protein RmuC n=1 Tax=Blattabacterium cuenoti TaxID=1653831 RepID=UPI001EEB5CD2|nr:DNA recombination protein RmuC [Blattabacterium cuenoti]
MESSLRNEFINQRNEIKNIYFYDKDRNLNFLTSFKNEWIRTSKDYQNILSKDIKSYNQSQSTKIDSIYIEQNKFIDLMNKNVESIKNIITNELKGSIDIHLGRSFNLIENQLTFLQKGLGEMKILANDISSLKNTLNHVKICSSFSEMQLSMLLEQILSPGQYASNVITRPKTNYVVEFAIKFPGNGDHIIWLPIDVKFPKETYEKLQNAYRCGLKKNIEIAKKNMELVLKKMSKDIKHKYIEPPNTTDFAILFLPFEGIYVEVIKNSSLLEELLKKYKTIIAGPSTLAVILNSFQVGFRTLAIQKQTSEVWDILESIKQEFSKFGYLLNQAKDKLNGASKDIDQLLGVRSNLIEKKFKKLDN